LLYLDTILNENGQTWINTYLYTVPFAVVGPFGFFANIVCFFILLDPEFNSPLYAYMRVYVCNSTVINLVSCFFGFFYSSRLNDWSNAYWTWAYYVYVYVPFSATLYLYGTVIDIVITIDRIGKLRMKEFIKIGAYKVCAVSFAFSVAVNFVYCFAYKPGSIVYNEEIVGPAGQIIHGYTRWVISLTDFATSELGNILLLVLYTFRDLILMLVEIIVNCVSLFFIRKFVNSKVNAYNQIKKLKFAEN
jgi:hypothetical protein